MSSKQRLPSMKTPAISFFLALMCSVCAAQAGEPIDKDGGTVTSPITGKVVRVVNRQSRIPQAVVNEKVKAMQTVLQIPFKLEQECLPDGNVGIDITIADSDAFSALLIEPEAGKATVNVNPLFSDSPSMELLNKRIERELWRALAFIAGGADADFQPCLMRPIASLSDLDEYPFVNMPNPMVMSKIESGAEKRDVHVYFQDSYRAAYEEGWAPPPANEVQRRIKAEIDAQRASKKRK